MEFKNIVFVPKLTMVQVDMHRYGLDEKGLMDKYRTDHKDVDRIFESYKRQLKSIELIKRKVKCTVIYREGFNSAVAKMVDLVLPGGGDDHLKYLSHYVENTPVLGLNTDPVKSRGEMLEDNIEEALEKLHSGQYDIQERTRIEAIVNGAKTFFGLSNYVVKPVGNAYGNFRHALAFQAEDGPEPRDMDFIEHPITTALHVNTGLGITDWSRGAGRYLCDGFIIFAPSEKKIAWVVESPHDLYGVSPDIIIRDPKGLMPDRIKPNIPLRGRNYGMLTGVLGPGDKLHLICLKDNCGAAADAINEHNVDVHSGYKIIFRVSDQPLRQVKVI